MNCFGGMVDQRKALTPYFQLSSLSEILTIANLRHAEPGFGPAQSSNFVEWNCTVVKTLHHGFLIIPETRKNSLVRIKIGI